MMAVPDPTIHELVIDGYNLLCRLFGGIDVRGRGGLWDKRNDLLACLELYTDQVGLNAHVVFDGRQTSELRNQRRRSQGRLRVVYTKPHETADDFIERHCRTATYYREKVVVITSDVALGGRVTRHGASWVNSTEMIRRMGLVPFHKRQPDSATLRRQAMAASGREIRSLESGLGR